MRPSKPRRVEDDVGLSMFPDSSEIFEHGTRKGRSLEYQYLGVGVLLDKISFGPAVDVVAATIAITEKISKNNLKELITFIQYNIHSTDEIRRWACYRLLGNLAVSELLKKKQLYELVELLINETTRGDLIEDEALASACLIGADLRMRYHKQLPEGFWNWIEDWLSRLPPTFEKGVGRLTSVQAGLPDIVVTTSNLNTVVASVKKYPSHPRVYTVIPAVINSLPVGDRKSAVKQFDQVSKLLTERKIPHSYLRTSLNDVVL